MSIYNTCKISFLNFSTVESEFTNRGFFMSSFDAAVVTIHDAISVTSLFNLAESRDLFKLRVKKFGSNLDFIKNDCSEVASTWWSLSVELLEVPFWSRRPSDDWTPEEVTELLFCDIRIFWAVRAGELLTPECDIVVDSAPHVNCDNCCRNCNIKKMFQTM